MDSGKQGGHEPSRRQFLNAATLGGLTLGALGTPSPRDPWRTEREIEYLTQQVNRASSPTKLKITDLRIAEVTGIPFRCPIIRIDTNQGVSGYGEVRDAGPKQYALMLKSRILGENPCNVEKIFKIIKQFGHHGRQGGGVSGVETALWDLAGRAYGVPVYQMLGGRYRDRIRLYADTTASPDPHEFGKRMKATRVDAGYTALKMDLPIEFALRHGEGLLVNTRAYGPVVGEPALRSQYSNVSGDYGQIDHPFTRIQITEKGLDRMEEYVSVMREYVGYEIQLGIDHTGHFDKNEAIKLARRMEKYSLAYMEDLIPWMYVDDWKEISDATTTPTKTGEDIFSLEGFKPLIDKRAVDIVHPDLGSTGGILESKRITDYASEHGVMTNYHYAGSPVGFYASVHAAAASQYFGVLEHHSVGEKKWYDMVAGDTSGVFDKGYTRVPDGPGLGFELDLEAVKASLVPGTGFFDPTPEWNEVRSWDRLWS